MASNNAQNGSSSAKSVKDAYLSLLIELSLVEDMSREVIFGNHGYGRNNAYLGTSENAFQALIKSIQSAFPFIASSRLIEMLVMFSVIELFDVHIEQSPLDPEADIRINNVISVLDADEISGHFTKFFGQINDISAPKLVVIPLMGVLIESSDPFAGFSFGECTVYPYSELLLNHLVGVAPASLGIDYKNYLLNVHSLIAVEVTGDFDFAVAQANKKAAPIVHVLNFYLASCYGRVNDRRKINLIEESSTADHQFILCVNVGNKDNAGYKSSVRDFQTYRLDVGTYESWEEQDFDKISHIFFTASKLSNIEKRLQRAITWYSKAMNSDGFEEQFISLTTALEGLLVGSEVSNPTATTASISQRIADRVAFLLGRDYKSRMEYAKQVKYLYNLRSKIVHEGDSVSFENLHSLNMVVKNVIASFIKSDFGSWDAFIKWENHHKYSSTGNSDLNLDVSS